MRLFKLIGAAIGVLLAAAIVVPLAVLAGLFVWLKLTEEADEEALELERRKMLDDVRAEVARLVVATSAKVLTRELSESEKTRYTETAAREVATAR